jgi:hypothetical protein
LRVKVDTYPADPRPVTVLVNRNGVTYISDDRVLFKIYILLGKYPIPVPTVLIVANTSVHAPFPVLSVI